MDWFSSQKTEVVPLDVPAAQQNKFLERWYNVFGPNNRLVIFAGDQKLEHLNNDFYGPDIDPYDTSPEHMFKIAQAWHTQSKHGVFATHLGLICQYAQQYPDIRYIVKLNGKTNLIAADKQDPKSSLLWDVAAVNCLQINNPALNICGIAYTVYLGSQFESEMLREAAHVITQAHLHGLLALLWIYPRGASIANEHDGNLMAGAAGVAACLGADAIKIHAPLDAQGQIDTNWLEIAVRAAGATKIVISGGKKVDQDSLLTTIKNSINKTHIAGVAVGRNIHQRSVNDAVSLLNDISNIVYK